MIEKVVGKRLAYFLTNLALAFVPTFVSAEQPPLVDFQAGVDLDEVQNLNSLCAANAAGRTFTMVGNVGCLQGSVGPNVVHFVGMEQLEILVVRSSGGFMEQLQPLIKTLSEKDFVMVVPEFCLSACAMYLLPLADQAIVGPSALVASHGAVFSTEEKYTEYFLTSWSSRAWRARWVSSNPNAAENQLKFDLRRMFFSYYSIKTRVASAFVAAGVDPRLFDAFEDLYECAGGNEAAKTGYDAYIELKLSFYAKYRDTSKWIWGDTQDSRRAADNLGIQMSPCDAAP